MNDQSIQDQKVTMLSKSFRDLNEVINDQKFKPILVRCIEGLTIKHNMDLSTIASLKGKKTSYSTSNLRLKRSTYDTLTEAGLLNVEAFSSEYLLISTKKSKLPLAQREYIIETCNKAIKMMVEAYSVTLYPGLNFGTKNSSTRTYIQRIDRGSNLLYVERTIKSLCKNGEEPDHYEYNIKEEQWDLNKTLAAFQSGKYYAKDGSKFIEAGFPPKDIETDGITK